MKQRNVILGVAWVTHQEKENETTAMSKDEMRLKTPENTKWVEEET